MIRFYGLLICLFSFYLVADESQIRVVGLFKNAALVEFNGQQKFYRVGQSISPKIKLIAATPHLATFDVNGKNLELSLDKSLGFVGNSTLSVNDQNTKIKVAKILMNKGMFFTAGYLNGIPIPLLIDTGASQVAMNERVAKKLGINYKNKNNKIGVSTAAGYVSAWRIILTSVKVGGIELKQVDGLVIEGIGPGEVLLGMSFLNRVKMKNDGNILTLTKKY